MHGLGNSQLVIDVSEKILEKCLGRNLKKINSSYSEIAQYLCDDRYGIGGSDQVLFVLPSKKADAKMRIFNGADGSEAEMCGNGIRCVGRYLYDSLYAHGGINELDIETLAGVKKVQINPKKGHPLWPVGSITVDMGKAELVEEDVRVRVGDVTFVGDKVSVGNPHYVVFRQNIKGTNSLIHDLARECGWDVEHNKAFPKRTNFEIARLIEGLNEIDVAVWERGVAAKKGDDGKTLSCGTGSCAVAFDAKKRGFIEDEITIHLLGGHLKVKVNDDDTILMDGPAEYISEGKIYISELKKNIGEWRRVRKLLG